MTMTLIQTAVTQRSALADAQQEIALLRAALESRPPSDEYPTLAEIRLRAFDQARAAVRVAQRLERAYRPMEASHWLAIADCFRLAGERLTTKRSSTHEHRTYSR